MGREKDKIERIGEREREREGEREHISKEKGKKTG